MQSILEGIYIGGFSLTSRPPLIPRLQVNTAARMETTSTPGRVQLSPASAELLRLNLPDDLALQPRGQIAVKGKVRAPPGWSERDSAARFMLGRD